MARILIVDDEEQILTLLGRMLERAGHQVSMASNAEQAEALIREQVPHIAFIDIVMPGMGGLTFIMERLKGLPPIVAIPMSGRLPVGADSILGLGRAMKVGGFLPKPFTAEELDRVLGEALAKVGAAAEAN